MRLYTQLRMDFGFLLSGKRIPGCAYSSSQLQASCASDYELEKVWKAYKCLEKPVLIHCSAGTIR